MKRHLLALAALLTLLGLLAPICAHAEDDEDDSPVAKEMGTINRSFKKLSRQYADPAKKDSSLELVAAIQKAIENSKTLTPSRAEKAADKAKFMDTYKKNLDELGKPLEALKEAISSDKPDAAKEALDKIGKMKASSHKELGVDRGGGSEKRGPKAAQPETSATPATSAGSAQ